MSRALLAAAGSGLSAPEAVSHLPGPGDATVAQMRPNGRLIGIVRVGSGQTYATLAAAQAAALTIQQNRAAAEGVSFGPKGVLPDFRVDILVYPGAYTEQVKPKPFQPIYCATGVQGDVVFTTGDKGSTSGLGTLHTDVGTGIYVENIDFVRSGAPSSNQKYPQHHTAQRTSIFVGIRYYSETSNATGGWTCVGMDGDGGATSVWYGCEMWQKQSGTYQPGQSNLHGWPTNTVRSDYIWVDGLGSNLQYNPANDTLTDALWVVGGSYATVTTGPEGAASVLHLSPTTTVSGTITVDGTSDTSVAWPIPTGGLSAADHTYYYGTP